MSVIIPPGQPAPPPVQLAPGVAGAGAPPAPAPPQPAPAPSNKPPPFGNPTAPSPTGVYFYNFNVQRWQPTGMTPQQAINTSGQTGNNIVYYSEVTGNIQGGTAAKPIETPKPTPKPAEQPKVELKPAEKEKPSYMPDATKELAGKIPLSAPYVRGFAQEQGMSDQAALETLQRYILNPSSREFKVLSDDDKDTLDRYADKAVKETGKVTKIEKAEETAAEQNKAIDDYVKSDDFKNLPDDIKAKFKADNLKPFIDALDAHIEKINQAQKIQIDATLKLDKYRKPGDYVPDLAKFLRDNPKQVQVLKDAGYTDADIKEVKDFNYKYLGTDSPDLVTREDFAKQYFKDKGWQYVDETTKLDIKDFATNEQRLKAFESYDKKLVEANKAYDGKYTAPMTLEQFQQNYFADKGWKYDINRSLIDNPKVLRQYDERLNEAWDAYKGKFGMEPILKEAAGNAANLVIPLIWYQGAKNMSAANIVINTAIDAIFIYSIAGKPIDAMVKAAANKVFDKELSKAFIEVFDGISNRLRTAAAAEDINSLRKEAANMIRLGEEMKARGLMGADRLIENGNALINKSITVPNYGKLIQSHTITEATERLTGNLKVALKGEGGYRAFGEDYNEWLKSQQGEKMTAKQVDKIEADFNGMTRTMTRHNAAKELGFASVEEYESWLKSQRVAIAEGGTGKTEATQTYREYLQSKKAKEPKRISEEAEKTPKEKTPEPEPQPQKAPEKKVAPRKTEIPVTKEEADTMKKQASGLGLSDKEANDLMRKVDYDKAAFTREAKAAASEKKMWADIEKALEKDKEKQLQTKLEQIKAKVKAERQRESLAKELYGKPKIQLPKPKPEPPKATFKEKYPPVKEYQRIKEATIAEKMKKVADINKEIKKGLTRVKTGDASKEAAYKRYLESIISVKTKTLTREAQELEKRFYTLNRTMTREQAAKELGFANLTEYEQYIATQTSTKTAAKTATQTATKTATKTGTATATQAATKAAAATRVATKTATKVAIKPETKTAVQPAIKAKQATKIVTKILARPSTKTETLITPVIEQKRKQEEKIKLAIKEKAKEESKPKPEPKGTKQPVKPPVKPPEVVKKAPPKSPKEPKIPRPPKKLKPPKEPKKPWKIPVKLSKPGRKEEKLTSEEIKAAVAWRMGALGKDKKPVTIALTPAGKKVTYVGHTPAGLKVSPNELGAKKTIQLIKKGDWPDLVTTKIGFQNVGVKRPSVKGQPGAISFRPTPSVKQPSRHSNPSGVYQTRDGMLSRRRLPRSRLIYRTRGRR